MRLLLVRAATGRCSPRPPQGTGSGGYIPVAAVYKAQARPQTGEFLVSMTRSLSDLGEPQEPQQALSHRQLCGQKSVLFTPIAHFI